MKKGNGLLFWGSIGSIALLFVGALVLSVSILVQELTQDYYSPAADSPRTQTNQEGSRTALAKVRRFAQAQLENVSLYVVRPGDTLFHISRQYGLTVQTIVEANGIVNPNVIHIGQQIMIPGDTAVTTSSSPPPATGQPQPASPAAASPEATTENPSPLAAGVIYSVQQGDSLHQIARRFNTTVTAIMAANHIVNPQLIYRGQQLLIPQAAYGLPVAEVPTAVPTPTAEPPAAGTIIPPEPTELIWPSDNRGLYQRYRYGHQAIDIAMPTGTSVLAAAAGIVEFSGWHDAGFGYLVLLDHGNGLRTLYAHNSELLVTQGQFVVQGEPIALSGSTGNSTHPHVHFGITDNARLVDPCPRLPGGC